MTTRGAPGPDDRSRPGPSAGHGSKGIRASLGTTRRDRHGRRYRGPLAWPKTPSMRTRSQAFDDAVLRAVEGAEQDWKRSMEHIDIAVEEVPPSDPSSWEEVVPLGRAFPAHGRYRARMIVYRLPIQTRARDDRERDALVEHVVRSQLAGLLGRHIDDEDDL